MYGPLNGKQVIEEAIREKALFRLAKDPKVWLSYMFKFTNECLASLTISCSEKAMKHSGVKPEKLDNLIELNTKTDKDGSKRYPLLDEDLKAIIETNPIHYPSLYINGFPYKVS